MRNPFIRSITQARAALPREGASTADSSRRSSWARKPPEEPAQKEIPVGIQRLHKVLLPSLVMAPIYWSPLHDVSSVVRGTWFYKDTMLPVESEIANRLEMGWKEVRAWTEEWGLELGSAVEVGREGEEKVRWKLWDRESLTPTPSRPGSAGVMEGDMDAQDEQGKIPVEGADTAEQGKVKANPWDWVLFADARDAFICRDSMLSFGNKRPLASIRRGKTVGTHVVRGFDEKEWLRLYPPKKGSPSLVAAEKRRAAARARGRSAAPEKRSKPVPASGVGEGGARNEGSFEDSDEGLGLHEDHEDRGKVTDLVLVIHG